MPRDYDAEAVERKWLARWQEAGIQRAVRPEDSDGRKFFIHFAYPGISGYLHVGHMRGFSYADIIARYKRMTGHHVLYPGGFHASGIPSVGLARRVGRKEPATIEYLRANGCPEDVIPTLEDPKKLVQYFAGVYHEEYWKRFGFLIDERTLCTTIDPAYQRFIQWQFRRLNDLGLLIQKPHFGPFCPEDGAVAVDASETDISQGGDAEVKEYTNVLFRGPDGVVLPCATLRPETVFGVTNLWIDPHGEYVRLHVGKDAWVVGADSADRVRHQRPDVGDEAEPVSVQEILSWTVRNPITQKEVPVLEGRFVDPARGTGVVMSVPAHAPFDWQALKDLGMPVEPVVIIDQDGVDGVPAELAVQRHGVSSQDDEEALDAATDEVYGSEFIKGRLNDQCGEFAGRPVREAKDAVRTALADGDDGGMTYEFSVPVVCRCGRSVVIRRIPDQWFIKYSDEDLTRRSQEHAASMRIFPEEYQRDMPNVLAWFGDRACIRRGSWLGTPFPFDEEWIIEPISDSTFYSAFYIVSPYVNDGRLAPEDLTDEFFDYVLLGKGKPKDATWEEARADFQYWYPVDVNLGGKEHKTVHFPVYVMNHVALLGSEGAPRGIFVNWWVTQKAGEKISKSKGGAEPIPGAAKDYSVDGMRLYYANVASAHVDIEWDREAVVSARSRVERIHTMVSSLAKEHSRGESPGGVDDWLEQTWHQRLRTARAALDAFDLRTATTELYFEFYNDLQWHRRRGGLFTKRVRAVVKDWVASLAPVTPFVAEELWHDLGDPTLVSIAHYPVPSIAKHDASILERERYIRGVLEDLGTVRRVAKVDAPQEVHLYTSPEWKRRLRAQVVETVAGGQRDMGPLIKQALADPELKPHAKQVASFVQRVAKEAIARSGDGKDAALDEQAVLADAAPFFSRELGGARVAVHDADDQEAPDPGGKRAAAQPGKPAIYMV